MKSSLKCFTKAFVKITKRSLVSDFLLIAKFLATRGRGAGGAHATQNCILYHLPRQLHGGGGRRQVQPQPPPQQKHTLGTRERRGGKEWGGVHGILYVAFRKLYFAFLIACRGGGGLLGAGGTQETKDCGGGCNCPWYRRFVLRNVASTASSQIALCGVGCPCANGV